MKPIIFSGPMVAAIYDLRKTQTRRVIKPQPDDDGMIHAITNTGAVSLLDVRDEGLAPYRVGDVLYVRETWTYHEGARYGIIFKARCPQNLAQRIKWKPSIHMPKEAARLFMRVTDVRAERVNDISEADALAEGVDKMLDHSYKEVYEKWRYRVTATQGIQCDPGSQADQPYRNYLWHGYFGKHGMGNKQSEAWDYQYSGYDSAIDSFSSLWELINAKRGFGWYMNPWVWAYTFERCGAE